MKNKLKNVFKIIGCSCLAVLIALSCVLIPKKINKNQSFLNSASANVVTETSKGFIFNGIYGLAPACTYDEDLLTNNLDFNRFSSGSGTIWNGQYFPNAVKYTFDFQPGTSDLNNQTYLIGLNGILGIDVYFSELYDTGDVDSFVYSRFQVPFVHSSFSFTDRLNVTFHNSDMPKSSHSQIGFNVFYNPSLNSDKENVMPSLTILYVQLSNSYTYSSIFGIEPSFPNSNIVTFVDSNYFHYSFYIPNHFAYNDTFKSMFYDDVKFYLRNNYDFSDNDYYQQGLSNGYSEGYNDGEQNGYRDGYSSGLSTGKNLGYNEGLQANDRLTFTGLMTSVIDVPVKVFVSLFDFDILGVNILVFLSTLLTICLVLFLIKKIKGA